MLDYINIDRINYTNISSVEQKRLYSYMYLLSDISHYQIEYLLNTSNIDTHSVIEKFIYDIACTQLSTKLDKQFIHGVNYITFKFLKKERDCCDKINFFSAKDSIMTSIINLSHNITCPLLFLKLTNFDWETNNTQHINECEICVSKQGNILTFDPNKYMYDGIFMFKPDIVGYHDFDIVDMANYSLVIQIVNKQPIKTPVFNYDINSAIVSQMFNRYKYELHTNNSEYIERICYTIESITEEESVSCLLKKSIFSNALNNLFELKDNNALNILSKILEPYVEKRMLFKLKVDEKNDIVVEKNDIVDESVTGTTGPQGPIDDTEVTVNVNDKFIQRFTHRSIITPIMCDWIIHEAEQYAFKHGWSTTRHDLYPTTDIPVENIESVFKFMLLFMKQIDKLICKSYNIEIESLDIKDMFIAKYEFNQQNSLDMHVDGQGSNFSISILLNDGFDGGNLIYADDIIADTEPGDMIIHTKYHKHGVTPVTKGIRYALVMFMRIKCID